MFTGFGRFNLKVALLGALIYFNVAFTVMSTGFVLPAAACDFQMTTIDKGYIIAAPLLGQKIINCSQNLLKKHE